MKINNICFGYKNQKIIFDNLTFEIPNNSIYFLLGPNGAGKTTLLNLVFGKLQYSQGNIVFQHDKPANNLFFMQDKAYFYSDHTARINLELFCDYRGLSYSSIDSVLDRIDLKECDKAIKNFSLGMKKRLSIGLMMLSDSSINLLDEPLNGLDPHGIILLRDYIIDEHQRNGKSFIISSHLLNEFGNFCTHYGILNNGKIVATGENNSDSLENIYLSNIKK